MRSARCLVLASLAILAVGPPAYADPAQAEHVLSRAGFGGDAWSRARIAEIGPEAYLAEQLDPSSIDDSDFEAKIAGLSTLDMNYRQLRAAYSHSIGSNSVPLDELSQMHFIRAVHSRRQLEAVLVDFWFDHFNVYMRSGMSQWDAPPYERDAIRANVLGRFEDMLSAVARSPSMLDYLDNHQNAEWGINENYARELLELHTVGVDGGYSQADVIDVARAFTGWKIDLEGEGDPAGFLYWDRAHDSGQKLIMNALFISVGRGIEEGEEVLRFLAGHPNTANTVARKLAQRFVNDDPPPALVAQLAQVYLETGGDLRAVTEALLLSDEFLLNPANRRVKAKRPVVFVVSAVRALGAALGPGALAALQGDLRTLGEEPFHAKPPIGYPDDSRMWVSSNAVMARIETARAIAAGERDLVFDLAVDGLEARDLADALFSLLLPALESSPTRKRARVLASEIAPEDAAAVVAGFLLASPEFLQH